MTNLDPRVCLKLRAARQAAKVSQSELAAAVGCKQSALSMFEQGQPTKLNDEVVERIAKRFGLTLKAVEEDSPKVLPVDQALAKPQSGFCPNPHCPSNKCYQVDGRTFALPDLSAADPVGHRFCAYCGEVLERMCPNCGSPVHAGAVCSFCGDPYIAI